jgi:hypothetical protein
MLTAEVTARGEIILPKCVLVRFTVVQLDQKAGDLIRKHSYLRRLTYMLLLSDHQRLT